ncbi:MAG: hypothetical protein AADX98_19435 [Thiocapsa sp. C3-3m]
MGDAERIALHERYGLGDPVAVDRIQASVAGLGEKIDHREGGGSAPKDQVEIAATAPVGLAIEAVGQGGAFDDDGLLGRGAECLEHAPVFGLVHQLEGCVALLAAT